MFKFGMKIVYTLYHLTRPQRPGLQSKVMVKERRKKLTTECAYRWRWND